ncbi:MAG TPA: DinB family protein [Thermoanaerobaculia bacterium]|nr:DinB family protein [Thermoanaerobaculia bacterium]
MKLTELFLADLEREAAPTRRVLENVPDDHGDWKPHEKSMPLGYLATLVATLPGWIAMMLKQDELDLRPPGGSQYKQPTFTTARELLAAFDDAIAKTRAALAATSEEHLMTTWKLLAGGNVISAQPRHVVIRDTFGHLAHHRGQLTVYLRLNDAHVPSIYGPTADEPL